MVDIEARLIALEYRVLVNEVVQLANQSSGEDLRALAKDRTAKLEAFGRAMFEDEPERVEAIAAAFNRLSQRFETMVEPVAARLDEANKAG